MGVIHWNTRCWGLSFGGASVLDEKKCLGNREWVRQPRAGWVAVWVSLRKAERGWSIETTGGLIFGCILSTGVLYFPTF